MKIANKIKMAIMGLSTVATLGSAALIAPTVSAANDSSVKPVEAGSKPADRYVNGTTQENVTGDKRGLMDVLQVIINVVLGVIAFIAVVMIIMGGIQYTTSSGDTAKVTKAKNTILYGVVGLIIALLAFAIVNFVIGNVFGSSSQ